MKKTMKNFFKTPKNAVIAVISTAALITILGTATLHAASSAAKTSSIGEETAQNYAYVDSGIDPSDVQYVKTEFDYDDGQYVYEVDFTANGKEYEYKINAYDGTVIRKSVEVVYSERTITNTADILTLNEAKEIALTDAELTADEVTFVKTELDKDNGIAVYDIEFITADAKYEYEISRAEGKIYGKSKDIFTTAASQNTTQTPSGTTADTANITLEQAKEIAAADAGVSSSDAAYTTAKQDKEDGIIVYDIEFYYGSNKYEYEISAADGTIREKSVKERKSDSGTNKNNKYSYSETTDTGSYISLDEAKQIAAEKAGFSVSEVVFKKAKLDKDDGIKVYEIEFYSGRTEYECTINASTGAVIEFEIDD
ncbi:MAG: PepSY domain-containing protein [Clostridiales bacterium]|nr:PepSY domain-containing protein [Clostridiales bacterium]